MVNIDDFLSNNVNGVSGDVLLCDTYVIRLYPDEIESLGKNRACFSYSPEACHIDQLGFKLSTVFRLGRVTSLDVLTKDGSPHALQIPLVVQEAAANCGFAFENIRFFVIEKGERFEVSHEAVRTARHLSRIQTLVGTNSDGRANLDTEAAFSNFFVAILIGGRKDLNIVEASGMLSILDQTGIRYRTSVISSEQNPEELRRYCQTLAEANVSVIICIAGSVPGLPGAVKAHLPAIPVVGVPLSVPEFSAREILMSSLCVPARRPIILTGIDDSGLRKAAYLACDIISSSSDCLRAQYARYLRKTTPSPDYDIDISAALHKQTAPKNFHSSAVTPNGKEI